MSLIETILSKKIANELVRVDESSDGLKFLDKALKELQQRLENDPPEAALTEASIMRVGAGEIFELAYKDWKSFCERWSCTIHYWEHPELSNNFTFVLKTKTESPATEKRFRFSNLSGAKM